MGNALVIAVVTAVIKDILENGLANDPIATSIGDTLVTALPPDRVSVGTDERPQLNVFLYQVSQNRNADWVGRDRLDSHRISPSSSQPPLALDLHYLLTAYGAKDFQAELLLGYAMQLLHGIPALTQDMVKTALTHATEMRTFGVLSQALATLSIAELVDRVGTIKLCPEFFSMEETSKLWSSLQTHYRPSAGYQASMVLIESRRATPSLPSAEIGLRRPCIEQVSFRSIASAAPTVGDLLMIRGHRLQGTMTQIRFTGQSSLVTPQEIQDSQISLPLPLNLSAGIQGVQVVHREINPDPGAGQQVESNVAAFVVHPSITIAVNSVQGREADLRIAEITITVKPPIGKTQRAVLLLHDRSGLKTLPYQVDLPPRKAPVSTVVIPVQVEAGTYKVQLQVEGSLSAIEGDSLEVTIP